MASPALPNSLKPINHHLKVAKEYDKRDPVIAYWCRMFAVQRGIKLDSSSKEAKAFLFNLMDELERTKKASQEEALHSEVVGQAHFENTAMKLFLYADNEDRAGRHTKNVIKAFYTSSLMMDAMATFGELTDEIEQNKKYARWKATYINKCFQTGETPIAGPLPEEGEDEAIGGAPAVPTIGFDHAAGPSMPPNQMTSSQDSSVFPAAGSHAPPSTPQDPMRLDYQQPGLPGGYQPQPTRGPQPVPTQQPQAVSNYSSWTPPPNPGNFKMTQEHYQRGTKLCKFAISALQYEDSPTAIENLQKALKLLTTGKET